MPSSISDMINLGQVESAVDELRAPAFDISVIIPAYNAQDTLGRAIESALSQDIDNVEIIIVNDGSTDETQSVAIDYARHDKRIKVITQPNSGLGATRNRGIQAANGEVIALLDSDDEFTHGSFSRVLETLKKSQADLVASDLIVVDGVSLKPSSVLSLKRFPEGSIYYGDEAKRMFCRRVVSSFCPTYFYRKSFLDSKKIRFPEPGRFLEDIVFMSELFSRAPVVACLSGGPTYRYYMRSDSLAHNKGIEKAQQALQSIYTAERNISDVKESEKFIIEQLLFTYYLASDDDTDEGNRIRSQIANRIKNSSFSSILNLSPKDLIKTMLIIFNARQILRILYN